MTGRKMIGKSFRSTDENVFQHTVKPKRVAFFFSSHIFCPGVQYFSCELWSQDSALCSCWNTCAHL
uniref:Uncharacterized protein n=1 Tax=Anguilla anguilla TaxID=7936 RepID=A0A0E9W3X2_ANGAN